MLLQEVGYLMRANSPATAKRSPGTYHSKIEQHIVTLILGDESVEMGNISSEVQEMINFEAQSDHEDIDLVHDL